MQESRLKWQCRRGMRELDELLLGYLEYDYHTSDERQKSAFAALLALPDPELLRYLLRTDTPAPEFAIVVQQILDRAES